MQKTEKRSPFQALRIYLQYVPAMLIYQVISMGMLTLVLGGLRWFGKVLIYSTGRVALTSGDFGFILTTWQGWLFIITMSIMLFFIVAFELNGLILLIHRALRGERLSLWRTMLDAVRAMRRFFNREGLLICLYVALGVPLTGIGLSVPTTTGFKIPNFITSVISASPLYLSAYMLVLTLFAWFGFRNLFVLPYIVAEKQSVREARRRGHAMLKAHWKQVVFRLAMLAAKSLIILIIGYGAFQIVPIMARLGSDSAITLNRFLMLWTYYLGVVLSSLLWLGVIAMQVYAVMTWFCEYRDGQRPILPARERRQRSWGRGVLIGGTILITAAGAAVSAYFFDELFPAQSRVKLIVHRLGGNAAAENSLTGLRYAIKNGAYGYETDIQRAKDGTYVINHDSSFKRLCGDPRSASEMTWPEIQQLRLTNPDGTTEAPPSLEQVLDTAKGHGQLYLELKGSTADERMCDDVIAMARKKGMLRQCTLISLNYNLVRYISEKYSDVDVGFVYFFSFGTEQALACNALIMEEQLATSGAIATTHSVFKKAIVWTVNTVDSAHRFLGSEADALITDELLMCQGVRRSLSQRSDYERMIDAVWLPGTER